MGDAGTDAAVPKIDGSAPDSGTAVGQFALVLPVQRSGSFVYELGPVTMTIDAANGARITSFAYAGNNVLTTPQVNAESYGATFWPSPQAAWDWPPIPAIDTGVYTGAVDASHVLTLTSSGADLSGSQVTVTKRFTPRPDTGAIDVTYALTNVGGTSVHVAPWQISRVAAGGLTFFGKGPGGVISDQIGLLENGGLLWYKNDVTASGPKGSQKAFADGLGWVAHVAGDLLAVHEFADVAPDAAAPGEAEIEIYTGPSPYVEIEPQGAYQPLAPGASRTWTVRWFLRQLPPSVVPAAGNATLVAMVKSLTG